MQRSQEFRYYADMVNMPYDVTIDGLRQAYRDTMSEYADASSNHLKVIKESFEALLRLLQDDTQESAYSENDDDGDDHDVLDYNELKNCADLLEVGADVTHEELKKAYHAAMRRCHPDKGGSKEMAQAVVHAYQVLLECLDACRDEAEQSAGDEPNGDDFEDVVKALPRLRPYACVSCGKSFTLKCNLQRHQVIHNGAQPFECRHCGKVYALRYYLKEHEKMHGERTFKCTVGDCDAAFFKKQHLEFHGRHKHMEKPFACGQCGRRFAFRASLTMHESIHDRKQHRFKCDACSATFAQSYERILHKRKVHDSGAPTIVCAMCGRAFVRDKDLTSHVKKQHI